MVNTHASLNKFFHLYYFSSSCFFDVVRGEDVYVVKFIFRIQRDIHIISFSYELLGEFVEWLHHAEHGSPPHSDL